MSNLARKTVLRSALNALIQARTDLITAELRGDGVQALDYLIAGVAEAIATLDD